MPLIPSVTPDKWPEYLTWDRARLAERLCETAQELASLHQELATVKTGYLTAKVDGFARSLEASVTGREKDAERVSAAARIAVYDVEGQMAAVETERALLLWILEE